MERIDAKVLGKHWRWQTDRQGLAWLTFDKQVESANTFSRQALNELSASLSEIKTSSPKGLVIRSAKEGFIAGADVEEFTRFKSSGEAMSFVRLGWDVFQQLRDLPFPTTAMVDGFCMGGGVELALACRYRVALDDPKTRFALPEVMLGIMPAWHGVQWLPKLVGPAAALDMLLTGKSVDARRAKRMGLVDQAVPLRILENTARVITLEAPRKRNLGFFQRIMLSRFLRGLVVSQARKQVQKKARREHYPAPYAILELWKKYDGNPFLASNDASCSVEALFAHPTTQNLIRIFFLQERMKSLGKGADFAPRRVHVVGAGVMGGDVAAVCAMRGLTVTLQDTAPERIAPAVKRAAQLFKRRLRDERPVRDALDRLIPDVSGDGARHADVIIEAIFENLDAKRSLFSKL
jgi:3-hydroxyacyl-CoA dehydrogenase/enoyl-CoA hydratase/3-hydroxybutyryl-CoA epimerase